MATAIYRAAVIVLLVAVGTLATVLATQGHRTSAAPASTAGTVSSFNDGFATGKQDDCKQGFAAACQWLKSN